MTVVYLDTKSPVFCAHCQRPMPPRKDDGLTRFCNYEHSVAWHKVFDEKKVTKASRINMNV